MVKKVIIFSIIIWSNYLAFTQTEKEIDSLWAFSKPYDGMPGFFNNRTLDDFIQNNLCYPQGAQIDSLEGIIYIDFFIQKDGSTTNHKIKKNIRKDLDEEALRVAKLIKFDIPATQRGKPIKVKYTVPVKFFLPLHEQNEKKKE